MGKVTVMAITVNSLMDQMKERFNLSYIAGREDGEHVVTWVHLMEDASVAELFVGNELVVTSGYTSRDEASLLKFIDVIHEKPIAGLVINVGKYIINVPKSAIERCDEYGLCLLTMPWEMSATEFVKGCCIEIEKSAMETELVNQAAMRAIQSPNNPAGYAAELDEFFDETAGFVVMSISARIPEDERRTEINRAELRIRSALYHWDFQFLLFMMEQRFVLVINQSDRAVADEVAGRIVDIYARRGWGREMINIGIGEPVHTLAGLSKSYHCSLSAIRRGTLQKATIQRFSDMGFYKLLYSVPDDAILDEYYTQRLAPLIEYDNVHDGSYVETLFRYLLHDCSLTAVAEDMFTHKNTVNYRMGKIRELLGKQLDTQYDRFPLVLAFHIGVILGKIPDYEEDIVK